MSCLGGPEKPAYSKLLSYGVTEAQWYELKEIERRMRSEGHGRDRTPITAFTKQRTRAANRGIEWKLSLWEWWSVWVESGKWLERGKGGYVMCREGDRGAYQIGNVRIDHCSQNSREALRKDDLPMGVFRTPYGFISKRKVNGKLTRFGTFSTIEAASAAYQSLGENK